MAAKRQVGSSAYERRIQRYLAKHPGATRQEARGHKPTQPGQSEYQRRVAGTAPGSEERALAAGRRGYSAMLRNIKEGSIVGIDPVESSRNAKGQWTIVMVTILDEYGNEKRFRITKRNLTDEKIQQVIDRIVEAGAISSPSYPIGSLTSVEDMDTDDDIDWVDFNDEAA